MIELDGHGVLMGFDPEATYDTKETRLASGDRIVLYTDGIIETSDADGRFFGDVRFRSFVGEQGALGTKPFLDALLEDVSRWSGRGTADAPFEDDLTVVVADVR